MSVYVDDAFVPYGRMIMCHMIASTEKELHEMADKIGINRRWFQDKSIPHYDISKGKRELAIKHGARCVTIKELISIYRNFPESQMRMF